MGKSMTYYHNPRCQKSRQGLEILEKKGASFTVFEYLKTPLKKTQLKALFKKLQKKPEEVIRKKEALFKELKLADKKLTQDQWIDILIKNPKLLERPILESDSKAVVGRPPEEIKVLL